MSCAICRVRKEKRFCLALHDRICPQCCGEQREVTLDCPSECPYLQQARQHDKPRELGGEEMMPQIRLPQDLFQRQGPLIAGLLQTLNRLAHADRNLRDREIIAALTTMAHSYQTLVASGLVYQQASPNPAQAEIVEILQQSIEEFRRVEQQHLGYTALRDSDVLQVLVFMIRLGQVSTSGRPLARGFVDSLQQRLPQTEPAAQSGSIILP